MRLAMADGVPISGDFLDDLLWQRYAISPVVLRSTGPTVEILERIRWTRADQHRTANDLLTLSLVPATCSNNMTADWNEQGNDIVNTKIR